ncbi:zona pellucida glycoprotein 3d tandem duplicate 1 [Salminus brasiliensis]|uniref:zona pellucida glycoprotein 3d tandem duplicate 1 n=1 Tax=Salminus brasiliensis TaxID=930266 RepID=UPI003B839414
MGFTSSPVCSSLGLLGLLWCATAYTAEKNSYHPVSSVEHGLPSEPKPWMRQREILHLPEHQLPPYLRLPMFRHGSAPFVGMELFRPVPGRRTFPSALADVLVPLGHLQPAPGAPVDNAHGVEVWCGYRKVSVRINKARVGVRGADSDFHLGSCPVSRSSGGYIYFHYDLNECSGSLTTVGGHVVYSNSIAYRPEVQPEELVVRAVPLTLPIQCLYNRFHYSYKVGYLPRPDPGTFRKDLGSKQQRFSLSVCNEQWETLAVNGGFALGELMYFQAAAAFIAEDERIFVSSCHVTVTEDPDSAPRHDVISNSGCMVDSRRRGSLSRFVLRKSGIVRFTLDSFLFAGVSSELLYLHCTLTVAKAAVSQTSKSCTYNGAERRWEELDGGDYVCACCDSGCKAVDHFNSLSSAQQALVTSPAFNLKGPEGLPEITWESPNTLQAQTQVQFGHLQETAEEEEEEEEEEEVLQGELGKSLSSEVKQHEPAGQRKLIWAGGTFDRVQQTPAWNQRLVVEEMREEVVRSAEAGRTTMQERVMDVFGKLSLRNWKGEASVKNQSSSVTKAKEPESSVENVFAENSVEEETFLDAQSEPAEWNEGLQ